MRRLLIIAEHIAPLNSVASIRWTKLGKYLAKNFDYEVDACTNCKDYGRVAPDGSLVLGDPILAGDLQWFHAVCEAPRPWEVRAVDGAKRAIRKVLSMAGTSAHLRAARGGAAGPVGHDPLGLRTKRAVGSFMFDVIHGVRVRSVLQCVRGCDYDVVVSTYCPSWPHAVAAQLKRENPQLLWIADFRDFPERLSSQWELGSRSWASVYAPLADAALAVSGGELELLKPKFNGPCHILTNGFDPEELAGRHRVRADAFIIAYTGTLYTGHRVSDNYSDVRPLFQVVNKLIEEGRIDGERVEFVYAGRQNDVFAAQIGQFPRLRYTLHGHVPRDESVRLQDSASLLVLAVWNTETSQGIMSGRIYEYMASGVPIVGLCSGSVANSELKQRVEGAGCGCIYEEANGAEDSERLASYIEQAYRQWELGALTSYVPQGDGIAPYAYDRLAARLHGIIESLVRDA